jgi:hypothetical protein
LFSKQSRPRICSASLLQTLKSNESEPPLTRTSKHDMKHKASQNANFTYTKPAFGSYVMAHTADQITRILNEMW